MNSKIIHQIWITYNNEPPSEYVQNKMQQLKELYKDYEYRLYNDDAIKVFLKEHFDKEVLDAYETLKPFAFKADLARLCLLYHYGGYYFDGPLCPEFKFEPKEAVIFKGINSVEHTAGCDIIENNALFFPNKNHDFLKCCIDKILLNVQGLNYGRHPLDVTGPALIGSLEPKGISLGYVEYDGGHKKSYFNGKLIYIHKAAPAQLHLEHLGCVGINNYETMWFSGEVYNLTFSYVVATNGSNLQHLKMTLDSILNNIRDQDEMIVVGNINFLDQYTNRTNVRMIREASGSLHQQRNIGNNIARGNVVINCDDNVVFPEYFQTNLIYYIKNNYRNFDTLNVKTLSVDKRRWCDRVIERSDGSLFNIEYDANYDNRLVYAETILICKKTIFEKYPYDDNFSFSNKLKKDGFQIKIDTNNFVMKFDSRASNDKKETGLEAEINKLVKKYYRRH